MINSLAQALLKQRHWLFVSSLLVCLLSMAGLRDVSFDADPERYFTGSNPHLALLHQQQAIYGSSDTLLLVLDTGTVPLFSQSGLAMLEALHQQAGNLPFVSRVDSLFSYPFSHNDGQTLVIEPLVENYRQLSAETLAQRQQLAVTSAAIANRLVSHDSRMATVIVTADLPVDSAVKASRQLYQQARDLAQQLENAHTGADVLISGRIANRAVTDELALDEAMRLTPLMYLCIFLLLWYLLRSFFAMLAIMLLTTLSCLASLGVAMQAGIVLNLLSMTAGNIIITLSIAHCVHIVLAFLQRYRNGTHKRDALQQSLQHNLKPIMITSLTTWIGFFSMNLSDMPPAHDLGNITALGVAFAFALSLTLLPWLLLTLPISNNYGAVMQRYPAYMQRLSHWVIRYPRHLLGLCLLASLLMALCLPGNTINDRFTENIREPHPFRTDNQRIDEHFGGLYQLQYSLPAFSGKNVSDARYLAALDKLARWLRQQPEVRSVFAYSDILRQLNRSMHDDDIAADTVPANDALAAQYLLLLEVSQSQADMRYYLSDDRSATKLVVSLANLDSRQLIALEQRIAAYMQTQLPAAMQADATSLALMWAYLGESVLLNSLYSALFALLLISLVLLFLFRSVKYGVLSLIPNLLPAVIGYGFWGLYSGALDLGQMMVLTLTTGIVVDDTVHLLGKYLDLRRTGLASAQALEQVLTGSGAALVMTTTVLVIGFSLLTLSGFAPTAHLGLLTAVILAAALVFDLLLLPALLLLTDRSRQT